jgi:kynurenine formamidase
MGTLNLLTPEAVLRGINSVENGLVFPLNLPLDQIDPPLAGRSPLVHKVRWLADQVGHDDELSDWNTQSSTQWDGFRHIRHLSHGFYNGVEDEDHGVGHWAERGIVGRAVLADVARWREGQGRPLEMSHSDPIEADDLVGTLQHEGIAVEPGDILLIRTGWVGWYRTLDATAREELALGYRAPGLRANEDMARLLWNFHVAAVAADNPALEAWPPSALASPKQRLALRSDPKVSMDISLHFALLSMLGIPVGELWDLDRLADHCASDRSYTALLTSAPLNVRGGVASPSNAIAVR